MKEQTVKNLDAIEAVAFAGSREFKIKPIVAPTEGGKLVADFIEVEPEGTAFGYHWHETKEEIFFIISGTGTVKTATGVATVRAGDAITFPAGQVGSHVISNASKSEKLVYLDFGTNEACDIVHFPDMKKIMPVGPFSQGMYDAQ